MHSIQIPGAGIIKAFPSTISECTQEQYTAFAKANHAYLNGEISFLEVKITLLYDFLDMKRTIDIAKALQEEDPALDNILQASNLLESFYTTQTIDGNTFQVIHNEDVANPIPSFTFNNTVYYGPDPALTSITYGQYLEANNAYHDYASYKEERYLDLLIAVLYQKKDNPFNTKTIDAISIQLKNVDIGIKYGVFLFFGACIKWIAIQNELPMAGGATVDLTVLFEKPKDEHAPKGIGMLKSLFDLAETGVFGDIEATGNTPLYTVLVFLADKTIEARKNKRNVKS